MAPWQMIFKAAYVGNLGRRLGTTIDLNQPTPSPVGTVDAAPPVLLASTPTLPASPTLSPTASATTRLSSSPSKSDRAGLGPA